MQRRPDRETLIMLAVLGSALCRSFVFLSGGGEEHLAKLACKVCPKLKELK